MKPIVIIFIFLIFSLNSQAVASDSSISPDTIFPGDIFLATVNTFEEPIGSFNGNTIKFYPIKDRLYITIIPTDVHIKPGDYPLTIRTNKREYVHKIAILKKSFPKTKLSLPDNKVFLSTENIKRVEKESVRLSKIWKKKTDPSWDGMFKAPLNTSLSTLFGVVRIINGKKRSIHRGLDYRGASGTPVKAINSGRVVLKENLFYGGNTIIIDHGAGIYSYYMHLSKYGTEEQAIVRKGEVIGYVGSSGRTTGPHLHLGVKVNGINVNPESLYAIRLPKNK